MIILEDKLNVCLDVLRFLNEHIKYEQLNDTNFKYAATLWVLNEPLCRFKYGHISNWNTEKVTDMSTAFHNRNDFNEDLSEWNVSNVKNMKFMFYSTGKFTSDLSSWNVSNVTNMSFMFGNARNFTSDLSNWNVGNVGNVKNMREFLRQI